MNPVGLLTHILSPPIDIPDDEWNPYITASIYIIIGCVIFAFLAYIFWLYRMKNIKKPGDMFEIKWSWWLAVILPAILDITIFLTYSRYVAFKEYDLFKDKELLSSVLAYCGLDAIICMVSMFIILIIADGTNLFTHFYSSIMELILTTTEGRK